MLIVKNYVEYIVFFSNKWFINLNKVTTNSKLRYIIPIDKKNGLIMISYTDSKYANYWKKFLNLSKDKLNTEISNELKKCFNFKIKKPIYNSICYWNCGVSFWKKNIDSDLMSQKILKLNVDDNVYIIGENYSKNQGWIEGALETSRVVIDKILL